MNPSLTDLNAIQAVRAHRDQQGPMPTAPAGASRPNRVPANTRHLLRNRLAHFFAFIGTRLSHGHAES